MPRTTNPLTLLLAAAVVLTTVQVLAAEDQAAGAPTPPTATGTPPAAGSQTVEMTSGKTEKPIEITGLRLQPVKSSQSDVNTPGGFALIPGAYTLNQDDFAKLPLAKTNRELEVKKLGVANGDTIVLFSKRGEAGPDGNVLFEPCDSFQMNNDESEQVRPVNVYCNQTGYLVKGGLVALHRGNGVYVPLAQIRKRRAPVMGTDAGIALTIMKEEDSSKGYEFFEGATAYYSITRLRSPLVRLVANLSALDMDAKKDFETGLGFGLLLRTPGSLDDANNMGLGVLIGGGYNFMLDSGRDTDGTKREPWYWFVGFSWNFDRTNP